MQRGHVLGVDVGTTSTKAVVYDAAGTAHGHGECGYPLDEPAPGQAVQDPERVIEAVLAAAQQACSAGEPLAGVCFSSAMHSLVGLDDRDRPLTPLLTWADGRASAQAQRLHAERPELHTQTGTPLHAMSPLCKLAWFREEQPDVFARVHRWAGIKEVVVHRLTGEWVIDASCASGTGLLELGGDAWHAGALDVAGVTPEQLSRVVPADETLALRAPAFGAPAGTPVVVGAGDGPLANLGVGAVHPGVAACSIGTSGALRLMVEDPRIDDARRLFCNSLTPGLWAVGGSINNGGSVLRWAGEALAPDLGEHPQAALLDLAAEVPAGSEGLIMLPYLLSERAPHWSALPSGAYIGLTHIHRRGHLVRAALEGVCQQLALVLASMRDAGHEVREIRATGGFARSPLWCQMLTDALGMPLAFAEGHDGSAFGAALLGLEALGLLESIERAADLVRIDRTLEPDPAAAAIYVEHRPLFAELYDDLTPAFEVLRGQRSDEPARAKPR